ncbi:glycosyltransferase family 39 protein [Micromonospora sp. CPCC 205558]|uniref:glycosyltransferase family 39 protein n=1 Tax=Micromonospora sp. CPCC 205558 TaxID=3122403 RepID=UPI002FEED9FD
MTAVLDAPTPVRRRRRVWAHPAAAPIAASAATIAVSLYGIGRQFHQDEVITWYAATLPVRDLGAVFRHVDVVFAPYYLALHVWSRVFGASQFSLRVPSLVAMAVAAALVVVLGRRLVNTRVGLIGGLLFATLPAVSRYAQEARPYALAVAAALISTLALVWAAERQTWLRWAIYAPTVALLAAAHLLALMLLAAHLAYMASRRSDALRWAAAVAAGMLPVLPLLLLGSGQSAQVAWLGTPSWTRLPQIPGEALGAAAVGGLLIGAILAVRPPANRTTALLVTWGIVPPVVLFLVSLSSPTLHPRYLLFTVPAWCLLAAQACLSRWTGPAMIAAAILLGISGHTAFRGDTLPGNPDLRSAYAVVASAQQPGDGILHRGPQQNVSRLAAGLYLPERRPRDVLAIASARQQGSYYALDHDDANAAQVLQGAGRLWLFSSIKGSPKQWHALLGGGNLGELLRTRYTLQRSESYEGVIVLLLVPKH